MHFCMQNHPWAFCTTTMRTKAFFPTFPEVGREVQKGQAGQSVSRGPTTGGSLDWGSLPNEQNPYHEANWHAWHCHRLALWFESLIVIPMCLFPNWEMGIVITFPENRFDVY